MVNAPNAFLLSLPEVFELTGNGVVIDRTSKKTCRRWVEIMAKRRHHPESEIALVTAPEADLLLRIGPFITLAFQVPRLVKS